MFSKKPRDGLPFLKSLFSRRRSVQEDDEYQAKIVRSLPTRWIRRAFWAVASVISRPFIAFDQFLPSVYPFIRWIASRFWGSEQLANLLKGLPAMAVIIATGLLVENARSSTLPKGLYITQARVAAVSNDYAKASLLYDRACELNPERQDILFETSRVAQAKGDSTRADMLLNRLAPIDTVGYGPAHVLRARQILATAKDYAQLAFAEIHLKHATSGRQKNPAAEVLLGQIYLQTKEYDRAVNCLSRACDSNPEYSILLARALGLAGDRAKAERRAEIAIDHFSKLSDQSPTNTEYRLNWAEALSFVLRFEEAATILQKGLALDHVNETLKKALGEVHVAWFDHLLSEEPDNTKGQFLVMAAGIKANPGEVNFLQRVMTVIQRNDPLSDRAREMLREMIASGEGAALAHLILGTDSLEQKNPELAIRHFELAISLDETMAVAANNLAWALAFKDPPELGHALELIDSIANRWPNFAPYRDTRGQILAKMERWEEALPDLLAALPALKADRQIHETLGIVYEKLGLPDMATEHRKIASELK